MTPGDARFGRGIAAHLIQTTEAGHRNAATDRV